MIIDKSNIGDYLSDDNTTMMFTYTTSVTEITYIPTTVKQAFLGWSNISKITCAIPKGLEVLDLRESKLSENYRKLYMVTNITNPLMGNIDDIRNKLNLKSYLAKL